MLLSSSSAWRQSICACTSRRRRRRDPQLIRCAAGQVDQGTDVIALGNICLDVFVEVDVLPSSDPATRKQLLETLTRSPPSQESWEVGGNCNFMIAAARLGLSVGSLGHVGDDVYGRYVDDVLQVTMHAQGLAQRAWIRVSPCAHATPCDAHLLIHHSHGCDINGHMELCASLAAGRIRGAYTRAGYVRPGGGPAE